MVPSTIGRAGYLNRLYGCIVAKGRYKSEYVCSSSQGSLNCSMFALQPLVVRSFLVSCMKGSRLLGPREGRVEVSMI